MFCGGSFQNDAPNSFEMPKIGTFNLHASLLPDYRGAAPINFAIINGEEKQAQPLFSSTKNRRRKYSLQEELPISPDENAGSLHDRLMEMGAKLVVKTLKMDLAENSITEQPQPQVAEPKMRLKFLKKIPESIGIKKRKKFHNFIRGMSPYPWCFYF